MTVEFHFPGVHSLKEKRMLLARAKGRLRSRYNVAVAEVGFQEKWQRALLGVVSIGCERPGVEKTLDQVTRELESRLGPESILRAETDFLEEA